MTTDSEEPAPQVSSPSSEAVFKLFLGYAPGVGKTYSMLSEAIRRYSRGEDVVIGVVETHGRKPISELASRLTALPRRPLEYKGATFEEMDLDRILHRKPQVVLIDELAHTNIAGSRHRKRYEDVMDILAGNISVLSTLNIQHIESLSPMIQQITGVQVRETVPDWVLQRVNEIVLSDLTPEALQRRMERGDIYPLERAQRALGHFFRPGNLIALREMALRQVTHVVDRNLESFRAKEHLEQTTALHERIAVAVSSNPTGQYLIARASRMAEAMGGDLFAVHVDMGSHNSLEDQRKIDDNLIFAEHLGATVVRLKGDSVAEAMGRFIREKHITQVVFGRSDSTGWRKYLHPSATNEFLEGSPDVEVHIVPQQSR
jgi:two-component system sensor histidine kinase KdpD